MGEELRVPGPTTSFLLAAVVLQIRSPVGSLQISKRTGTQTQQEGRYKLDILL
jgi:hypothetical protein